MWINKSYALGPNISNLLIRKSKCDTWNMNHSTTSLLLTRRSFRNNGSLAANSPIRFCLLSQPLQSWWFGPHSMCRLPKADVWRRNWTKHHAINHFVVYEMNIDQWIWRNGRWFRTMLPQWVLVTINRMQNANAANILCHPKSNSVECTAALATTNDLIRFNFRFWCCHASFICSRMGYVYIIY